MRNITMVSVAVLCIFSTGYSQVKKNYSVQDRTDTKRVHFTLSSSSGTCNIKPTRHKSLVNIYEHSEREDAPFSHNLIDGTQYVSLDLMGGDTETTNRKISFNLFSSRSNKDEVCNVYLSQEKPLIMSLNYGVGDANIDLSGMQVEKLLINTGSADVNVSCLSGQWNKTEMDTFYVKVDMGELNVDQMNLTRSKVIIADVGFGNLNMDFTDKCMGQSEVSANVGAGKIQILLAKKDNPVIVKVNDSPLCRVKLTKQFRSLDKNTFVNDAYAADAENLITFNVGVAMGQIVF